MSGNEAVAYPHIILDWHEIVNDDVAQSAIAVTYCPLTGTGIGWGRIVNGSKTTFGVSGLLYNNNLIPYDRSTRSNWSQIRLDCVNGRLIGDVIETFPVVETTWGTWKSMFPETKVLSLNTGYSREYGEYPYGDYRTNNNYLLFPLSNYDGRLPAKERVHGIIINGRAKVYQFDDFTDEQTSVIVDSFEDESIVVVGSNEKNFIVSFYDTLLDGTRLTFTAEDNGEAILSDNEGNFWNAFGYAISGPRQGERLTTTTSFIGYWFSWGAFYDTPEIYSE